MSFILVNHILETHLIRSFALLDGWLDSDQELLNFRQEGEPTIGEMINVISQNNEHLLQIPLAEYKGTVTVPYKLDLVELENAARQWRQPPSYGDISIDELRTTLRGQLERALIILELAQDSSTEAVHVLAHTEDQSWDGFHRLYFMGLLIRQYLIRFKEIHNLFGELISE